MSRSGWRVCCILVVAAAAMVVAPLPVSGEKGFVMPPVLPSKSYPAHDEHPTEAISLAVDPYDLADKAKIFSVHYNEMGFVPMFVVITNDGDQPVELSGMKPQLVTASRAKISP